MFSGHVNDCLTVSMRINVPFHLPLHPTSREVTFVVCSYIYEPPDKLHKHTEWLHLEAPGSFHSNDRLLMLCS